MVSGDERKVVMLRGTKSKHLNASPETQIERQIKVDSLEGTHVTNICSEGTIGDFHGDLLTPIKSNLCKSPGSAKANSLEVEITARTSTEHVRGQRGRSKHQLATIARARSALQQSNPPKTNTNEVTQRPRHKYSEALKRLHLKNIILKARSLCGKNRYAKAQFEGEAHWRLQDANPKPPTKANYGWSLCNKDSKSN
ncbi:hypothetical protein BDV93DRAFT_511075 [Ceratobasidium sp. AG-I]|nr:hypothetical protein BDV93DRAFT_511075 [Ceratobasidium sp. AG-I]